MKMKVQTIRATANNLIEALRIDTVQCRSVARYEIKRLESVEGAMATIKRHNERCDKIINVLSMLYIIAYDGTNIEKMSDELDSQMSRVHDLRVDLEDIYIQ